MLGSPIRVSGYDNDTNGDYTGYLTYGYDEFGNDLYDEWEESGIPNPYSRQGEEQPFGYTGYRRDDISGTYFAQTREYQPHSGRFAARDKDKFYKAALPMSWNLCNYCAGNPLHYIDPQGNELRDDIETLASYLDGEIDIFGVCIGLHWLYGNGKEVNIYSDSDSFWGPNEWQIYMENNEILTGKVGDVVIPLGESLNNGESIEVDMSMPMEIENGECAVGYQFLHGTDETVGGFQIIGSISKNNKGDVTYDLTYTWNDIINPEYSYASDTAKAKAAEIIPFATLIDYNFHLSWHDKTVIKSNPGFFSRNSGWLKNYSSDWNNQTSEGNEEQVSIMSRIYGTHSSYCDCEVLK